MGIILVINPGSSSHKCLLFEDGVASFVAHMQWKEGFKDAHLDVDGTTHIVRIRSAEEGLNTILEHLAGRKIDAIGHRVVHGGELYTKPTRITDEVRANIAALAPFAPLHNRVCLASIEAAERAFPNLPHYAIFDTAFHHTLPEEVLTYPIPYHLKEKGIRKYGFHGISHHYCAERAKALTSKERIINCHLGAGASLCAIKEGKSVDTTMGMTPLEGLMMASRSGSIDPGVILYLVQQNSREAIDAMLNQESGLLGISNISEDMRDILEQAHRGHPQAQLALDMFQHRLAGHIAMLTASLGGLDALVFTGGIGENAPFIRQDICERLSYLGIALDTRANAASSNDERIISSPFSKIAVLVIPAQEERAIASAIEQIL